MKILCIGRNYSEHARELNNPLPESPLLFFKPATALLINPKEYHLPNFVATIDYELELAVHICRKIDHQTRQEDLPNCYDKLSLGIDFTARELQAQAKQKGLPWELAKAFDGSAVIGTWVDKAEFANPEAVDFHLLKNGICVQQTNSSQRIYNTVAMLAYACQYFTLQPGDILFTGTPQGVGTIQATDQLTGILQERQLLSMQILPARA